MNYRDLLNKYNAYSTERYIDKLYGQYCSYVNNETVVNITKELADFFEIDANNEYRIKTIYLLLDKYIKNNKLNETQITPNIELCKLLRYNPTINKSLNPCSIVFYLYWHFIGQPSFHINPIINYKSNICYIPITWEQLKVLCSGRCAFFREELIKCVYRPHNVFRLLNTYGYEME